MPCDEMKHLQRELENNANAQRMLKRERHSMKAEDRNELKKMLSEQETIQTQAVKRHKETCRECQNEEHG